MNEYISREALLKRLDMASDCKKCPRCVNMKTYYDRCAYTDIQDVCSVISDMPAADVQPVKHGRWEYYKNNGIFDTHKCTICGEKYEIYMDIEPTTIYKYCPNCGAKMDLS